MNLLQITRLYAKKTLRRYRGPRKSARVLIIKDRQLLVFFRKRHSLVTGEWIEYYSIPGGGIDKGETPEAAAVREMKEEMGVEIVLNELVAHRIARNFEHHVYTANIVKGEPFLQSDSEEAKVMNAKNQYIAQWVPVDSLTKKNLRYYADYLDLIQRLSNGNNSAGILHIDAR